MSALPSGSPGYFFGLLDSCFLRLGALKLFGMRYYPVEEVWQEARSCHALLGGTLGGAIASVEAAVVTGLGFFAVALIMFLAFLIVLGGGFAAFMLVVWVTCPKAISWTLHDVRARHARERPHDD